MDGHNFTSPSADCPFKPFVMPLSDIKIISGRYLIPPLFAVGVIGNFLNLMVLNSNGMRTKTNALLSSMAFADLCFFFCVLPTELISYNHFQKSHGYMLFFINSRMPLTAMTNFFSTASTWLAVFVTAERVVAIKMPLHAKFYWKRWRIVLTVVLIFCSSFLLACYNFVWMSPVAISYCNNTVFNYGLRPVNETVSPNVHKYVQISLLISPFFIVCLPMILLIVLNSNLLYYLHRNRKNMLNASNAPQMKVNEHKVAFMVAVIILSFIILSTPSAILYLYDWFTTYVTKSRRSATYIKAATVANLLVVVNKASNFVLYCSASSHFRRRLMGLICRQDVAGRCGSFSSRVSSQRRSTITSLLGNDGSNWIVQQLQKMSLTKTNGSSSTSGSKDDLLEMSNLLRKRSRSLLKERRFSHPSQTIIMPAQHNHKRVPAQRRLSQPVVTKRDSRNSLW